MYRPAAIAFATVLAAALLGPASSAASYTTQPMLPIGESTSLSGGAAAAAVQDGSALWYNPGGLGAARKQGISASVGAYGIQQVTVPGYVNLGGHPGDMTSTAVALVPAYLGYAVAMRDKGPFTHAFGLTVVMPDAEYVDGVIQAPQADIADELHGRIRSSSETIWALAGWGACWRHRALCLGISGVAAYRNESANSLIDSETVFDDGSFIETAWSEQRDVWAVMVGVHVGAQLAISENLRVGLAVRSPLRSVGGGGRLLITEATVDTHTEAPNTVAGIRRAEDQALTVDYRLPLSVRGGVDWRWGSLRLSLDVVASLAESTYAFVRGKTGSDELQPLGASNEAEGDAIIISEDRRRSAIVDVAVGARLRVNETYTLLAGAYTQNTGAGADIDDHHGDRIGVTGGISRKGAKSTTHVGLSVVSGTGQAHGRAYDANGTYRSTTHASSSFAIYLNVGGTADF